MRCAAGEHKQMPNAVGISDAFAECVEHDDQRRKRLAFHLFGHHEQRLAALRDLFQQRNQIANRGDLVVVNQDQRIRVSSRNGTACSTVRA